MRRSFIAGIALATSVLACASEDTSSAGRTDDLSRALLDQPATDGRSTPVVGGPDAARQEAPIQVAPLGFDRGSDEAPVRVVELSDYGCGYCRRFHEETFPVLRDEFIDTDMVVWKFIPFITGMFENSLAATAAAECALEQGDEPFEAINGRLWSDQREWKAADEPEPLLRGWVEELGLDMATYDGCLRDGRRMQRIIAQTTLARQIGVRGTPTFVVLGYAPLQGALPLEVFQDILTRVHEEEARKAAGG